MQYWSQNWSLIPSADRRLSYWNDGGAGDGDRTHDIKLGKLAFYH